MGERDIRTNAVGRLVLLLALLLVAFVELAGRVPQPMAATPERVPPARARAIAGAGASGSSAPALLAGRF